MTNAKAHANIALIKYWGKKDEELVLPFTSSLSLTLEALYTITEVRTDPELSEDIFELDGVRQAYPEQQKISRFVDLFRRENLKVRVNSHNNFPTAAGLASSASGFAALATALNKEFNRNLDLASLSRLTRRGSGSAIRSLCGGFSIWKKGDDSTSIVSPIPTDMDIEMIIVLISKHKKQRSSRELMKQTVSESPYYPAWIQQSDADFEAMQTAIQNKDLKLVGQIAERNAMMMHANLLALNEPFLYFEGGSLLAMDVVRNCRKDGIPAYFTMDAGPNVKIITNSENRRRILPKLLDHFSEDQIIVSAAGPAAQVIS